MNTNTITLTPGRPGRGTSRPRPATSGRDLPVIELDPKGDHRWPPAQPSQVAVRTWLPAEQLQGTSWPAGALAARLRRRLPVRRGLRSLGLSTWILLASGGTAWAQGGTVSGTGGGGESRAAGGGGGGVPDLAQNSADNAISTVQIAGIAVLSVVLAIPLIKAAANKKFGEVIGLLLIGGLVGLFLMEPKGTITTVQTFAKQFTS